MRALLFIGLLLLTSCGAQYHLKKSKRHELIAISKGAKIDRDTVFVLKEVRIEVPGNAFDNTFDPVIDASEFNKVIGKNDSLVLVIDKLATDLQTGQTLDREKTMAALMAANRQIKDLKDRLSKGFSKDSTYVMQPDSITSIEVDIRGGLLKALRYKRKDTVVTKKESLPVQINRILEYGYTYWQILCTGIGLLFSGLVVGYIIGHLRKRR